VCKISFGFFSQPFHTRKNKKKEKKKKKTTKRAEEMDADDLESQRYRERRLAWEKEREERHAAAVKATWTWGGTFGVIVIIVGLIVLFSAPDKKLNFGMAMIIFILAGAGGDMVLGIRFFADPYTNPEDMPGMYIGIIRVIPCVVLFFQYINNDHFDVAVGGWLIMYGVYIALPEIVTVVPIAIAIAPFYAIGWCIWACIPGEKKSTDVHPSPPLLASRATSGADSSSVHIDGSLYTV
jgi:hypothetical protein